MVCKYFTSFRTNKRQFISEMIAPSVSVARWANVGKCSLINLTFIGFEEISSNWSVQVFSVFIGHHMDKQNCRNGLNYRIGQDCGPCIAVIIADKVTSFCHD